MLSFFSNILGWLESGAQFILSLIESLIFAIVALTNSITLPLQLISYMPAILGASVSIVVALMIVKFFIGR